MMYTVMGVLTDIELIVEWFLWTMEDTEYFNAMFHPFTRHTRDAICMM